MTKRSELLQRICQFNGPLPAIIEELRQHGWDSKKELVALRREDVVLVLNRYLQSQLTAQDVEDWANAIEGRDDIGFESQHREALLAAIHTLANPLLTHALNRQIAQKVIADFGM